MQVSRNYVFENRTPSIPILEKKKLIQTVFLKELKQDVMDMYSFKAPSVDYSQTFFYQQYWPIIGRDLHQMVSMTFYGAKAYQILLESLIVLIPNVDDPILLKDLRMISIFNVSHKVIIKLLVNLYRPLLDNLVGPPQGWFILGRGTKDNIILAQEFMHTLQTHKKGEG